MGLPLLYKGFLYTEDASGKNPFLTPKELPPLQVLELPDVKDGDHLLAISAQTEYLNFTHEVSPPHCLSFPDCETNLEFQELRYYAYAAGKKHPDQPLPDPFAKYPSTASSASVKRPSLFETSLKLPSLSSPGLTRLNTGSTPASLSLTTTDSKVPEFIRNDSPAKAYHAEPIVKTGQSDYLMCISAKSTMKDHSPEVRLSDLT